MSTKCSQQATAKREINTRALTGFVPGRLGPASLQGRVPIRPSSAPPGETAGAEKSVFRVVLHRLFREKFFHLSDTKSCSLAVNSMKQLLLIVFPVKKN